MPTDTKKEIFLIAACSAGLMIISLLFRHTSGISSFVSLSAAVILLLLLMKGLVAFFGVFGKRFSVRGFNRVLLLFASVMIALTLFEVFLQAQNLLSSRDTSGQGGSETGSLTMPGEWEKRETRVEGAKTAFYYHGKLHVKNEFGMRRAGPFPPKNPAMFRIMVVGDSLTYGPGIAESDTYCAVIERELGREYNIEVLNLGIGGYQTENVLWVIRNFTPLLEPDLIIYGVCLNDFLPSRVGQYDTDMAYPFPLPGPFKDFMVERTLSGKLFAERYNDILLKAGLRKDFIDDILDGPAGYQEKFERDVAAMNDYTRSRELPSIVAMVLNQAPSLGTKSHELTLLAEGYLSRAGMEVIPSERYYRENDGARMYVSKWEGHPNEKANLVFAREFIGALSGRPDLEPFRKDGAPPPQ